MRSLCAAVAFAFVALLAPALCAEPRYATTAFESAWKAPEAVVEIPSLAEKSFSLPALPQKTGKIVVLRFKALLKVQGNGCNNYLSMTLNSIPVLANVGNKPYGLPRLLNYSMKNFFYEKEDPSANHYFDQNRLCVFFTGAEIASTTDSAEMGWYLMDISDLVMSADAGAFETNALVLGNTAKPEYFGPGYFGPEYKEGKAQTPMLISGLEAGYLPLTEAAKAPFRAAMAKREPILAGALLQGKDFSVTLAKAGGMMVEVGKESYAVESNFSYPMMPGGRWNRFVVANTPPKTGEWSVSAGATKGSFDIAGAGKFYKLQRNVAIEGDHILIKDTFTNLTNEPVGVVFQNRVTPMSVPKEIDVSGKYRKTYMPYTPENVAWNPTIFFAGEGAGLGMAALDDYYRLQLALKTEGITGYFDDYSFGLPGKDSYTFLWVVYPLLSADYYDFINRVRKDFVPNYTIDGSAAFLPYSLPESWPRQKMADWLKHRNAKIVILAGPYSGGPWLGEDSNFTYKVPNFKLDTYLATLKKARAILREIDPEVKCLTPYETALSPDAAAGDLTPKFPDSVGIMPDGTPSLYRAPEDPEARKKFLETQPHQFIYYPTLTNSYYTWMRNRLERAMKEADADGFYFDLFSYACGDHGFRWTYDQWDNRSVDMDMSSYTIKRKKADLAKLSEDAKVEMVKMILGYKKGNTIVVNDMGVVDKIRQLPIFHFCETVEDYGYCTTHFSTPIVFGFTPGYAAGCKFIGKEGTWWQTWKTDKDYFEDVKDKLWSGCLYYTYLTPPGEYFQTSLTHGNVLDRMFPITIEEIHAGWIKGKERVITLQSGSYSWGDDANVDCYLYDSEGRESVGTCEKSLKGKVATFKVEVPPDGAAVLVRRATP